MVMGEIAAGIIGKIPKVKTSAVMANVEHVFPTLPVATATGYHAGARNALFRHFPRVSNN